MRTLFGLRGEPLQEAMNFCVVSPSFLAMGYSLSYLGGVTSYPSFYRHFSEIDTARTTGSAHRQHSLLQGTTNACLNLGAAGGCLSCIYVGNRLGRRKTVLIGSVVAVVGTVLMCSAFSLAQLNVARGESMFWNTGHS